MCLVNNDSKESIALPQSSGAEVKVHSYSGEKDTITIQPFGNTVTWVVPLKGYSEYPDMMLKIKHLETGKVHVVYFAPEDNGEFDAFYILKDGPGNYKILLYGIPETGKNQLSPSLYFTVKAVQELPLGFNELNLNRFFIDYVDSVLDTTVGDGDCWNLIQVPMELYHADWLEISGLGIPINPEKEDVLPGDIICFENAVFEFVKPGIVPDPYIERIGDPNHFAVIYRVKGRTLFQIAHQNVTDESKVILSEVHLDKLINGQVTIFRPIAGVVVRKTHTFGDARVASR